VYRVLIGGDSSSADARELAEQDSDGQHHVGLLKPHLWAQQERVFDKHHITGFMRRQIYLLKAVLGPCMLYVIAFILRCIFFGVWLT